MSNFKQLQLCWLLYADDNNEATPHVDDTGGNANNVTSNSWVGGTMTSPQDATNILILQKGLLYKYNTSVEIYHCPADKTTQRWPAKGGAPRVRSMSASQAFGPGFWLSAPPFRTYKKSTDVVDPGPAQCFVFVDEHPDSINDGGFAVQMPANLAATHVVDFPASYHNGAGGISFMDGHAEIKKWLDRRTSPPRAPAGNVATPNNKDVLWLAQRSSSRIDGKAWFQ